jgi:hypothetical protein
MEYVDYQTCIDSCLSCADLCNHSASASLLANEHKVMAKCIQLGMECAVICYATAQLMSLGSQKVAEFCRICAAFCETCAIECETHLFDHCKESAAACKLCAIECRKLEATN